MRTHDRVPAKRVSQKPATSSRTAARPVFSATTSPYGALAQVLAVVGAAWMALSAYAFYTLRHIGLGWEAGALFGVLGFFTLRLALAARPAVPQSTWGVGMMLSRVRVSRLNLLMAVLCLLLVAIINGHQLNITYHVQAVLLLTSMSLLVTAFPRAAEYRTAPFRVLLSQHALLILMTLGAFLLRLWHLETGVRLFVDEMNFASALWRMQQEPGLGLAAPFSEIAAFPRLYPYMQWWGAYLFGNSLFALRIISVIIGTLTVPALYGLAREIVDHRTALLATLLLAVFPPHIHFSRLGINNIADPLFGTLLLLFLVRALKYQHMRDYALAGVMLGLTQYFYEGGRILFPLLVLFWLEAAALLHLVRLDAHVARRIGWLVGVGVLVAFPVYYTLVVQGEMLFRRFDIAGVSGSFYRMIRTQPTAPPFLEHLTHPFLIYVQLPDVSLFYGGTEPLMLWFLAPLLLIGVAVSRLRHPGTLLLLLWLVGASLGSAFMAESAYSARFVLVFPALMLFMALGLRFLAGERRVILTSVAALIALVQIGYYFGVHLPLYNHQVRPVPDAQDALYRAAALPEAVAQVCFVTAQPLDETLLLQMRDFLGWQMHLCFIEPARVGMLAGALDAAVVFVSPDDTRSIQILQAHGAHNQPPDGTPYPQFTLLLLP
ncbi:MAG: hypothetical protein OHK0046_41030 [Anaerolineae bacterium]